MFEPKITPELVSSHGISHEEHNRIVEILGREPTFTELGIFSVMWSEHCSYKSSKVNLKKLPTRGERVIIGPGENAGAVDIGDGLAVIFKMESHNHPSFIEPYQGAATGVGGILRDIFTMGARPLASLNSLRFGPLDNPKNRYLVEGVVAGIAGYGNCIGVPTVGGEVYFDDCYSGNPLVNVFNMGIAKKDRIFLGRASGPGSPVIFVGSKTGRDGMHGCTMASEEFSEATEQKRPTVQVGDPFTEKLLLEACLEAMEAGCVLGIQDMGAAGLTCSTCEMAARGGLGIEIDVSLVPQRETGMTPYEIMLSESQERMLIVAARGKEGVVQKIFARWDLDAVPIGSVTSDGMMRVKRRGEVVAEIPVKAITDDAPFYRRPSERPEYLEDALNLDAVALKIPSDFNRAALELLSSPTIASKEWIYRQYDHMVRANTVLAPGSDAAVIRIHGTNKGVSMTVDCNGRYCYLDPYLGGMIAVAEAARNLVCSGARPIAVTDCLNFGNPEHPEVMWQFERSVEGIARACSELGIPVVSGNVSFYNETMGCSVYPTPVIGMVGLIEDISKVTSQWFKGPGDLIVLLGEARDELGATEYLKVIHGLERGLPPAIDLGAEAALQAFCRAAIESGLIKSAHDLSEGGLAVALAEACISGPGCAIGAVVELRDSLRPDSLLFGESQSRAIISLSEENLKRLLDLAAAFSVRAELLGRVGGDKVKIGLKGFGTLIDVEVEEAKRAWGGGFIRYFLR